MKQVLLFFAISLLLSAGLITWAFKVQLSGPASAEIVAEGTPSPTVAPRSTPAPDLPDHVSLTVPYTLQAPDAVFDALHEDSCEETSLLMVAHFLDNKPFGTKEQTDQEIKDLVHAGEGMGQKPSITLAELNDLSDSYFHRRGSVKDATEKAIKEELAAGRPVIAPMAGKILFEENKHFSNGGPNYHMLVIKGYDATGFITNEPGTYVGDGFHYSYDVIMRAFHDWNPQNILEGPARYLVF